VTNEKLTNSRRKRVHQDQRIVIRVTAKQKKRILALARKEGLSVSPWIKEKLDISLS